MSQTLTVPGIPTKRRVGPDGLHSNKLPGDAAAPGPQTTLLMTRDQRKTETRHERESEEEKRRGRKEKGENIKRP